MVANTLSTTDGLETSESLIEIKLSREKRDSCVIQEGLDLTANLLMTMSKIGHLKKLFNKSTDQAIGILDATSSLALFSGSIFGFHSPSMCDVDVKLDQILVKLKAIAGTLGTIGDLVQCTQIKGNYREISTKIIALLNIYDAFYRVQNRNGKESVRNAIVSRCNDHTEGLHQIYSLFQIILGDGEVKDFLKSCAHYELERVNLWSDSVKYLASLIIIVIKGCEEAYNHTAQFDPPRFEKEVKEFIRYHNEITYLKEFVQDQGVFGLRNVVKTIANIGKTADETAQTLKTMFTYFDWDVIFYSSEISGKQHAAWYSPNYTYCGSYFYSNELDHARNALVAWCFPNRMNSHSIIGNCSTRCTECCANRTRTSNQYVNYVLTLYEGENCKSWACAKKTPMKLDYNINKQPHPEKQTDKRKFIYHVPGTYAFVNIASRMAWKHETTKPTFTSRALVFE